MNFGATMYFTDYSMSPSERQIVRKNVDTHENGKLERFQPDWKRFNSNFASNFIDLTSLRYFQSA